MLYGTTPAEWLPLMSGWLELRITSRCVDFVPT
jgi:hypothetical protein